MTLFIELALVGLIGLATTCSVMIGAALGLYVPFPKKVLAGILAFAAGSLIAALAIELGFESASDLKSTAPMFTLHGPSSLAAFSWCDILLRSFAVPRTEGRSHPLPFPLSQICP